MNRSIRIKVNRPAIGESYGLVIGAVGYERRARHAVEVLKPSSGAKLALLFEDRQVYDFNRNRSVFEKLGFAELAATPELLRSWLRAWWGDQRRSANVWVDISSLSRPLIATVCYELFCLAIVEKAAINATFVYSHARFSPPPPDYGPIAHKGAVIPEFAGWSDDPTRPCSAIFGIGYEVGLALGVVEDLEPAETWAFRPTGHPKGYDEQIDCNNKEFLSGLTDERLVMYDVNAPLDLIARLESIVYGRLQTTRVVIIPFGLKLFALAAFLVALQHLPRVDVWRVSGGKLVKPINRVPSGRMSNVDVTFDGSSFGTAAQTERLMLAS